MTPPMTREKRDAPAGQGSKNHGIRRSSERGGHARLSHVFQAIHFVQPAASNDGNIGTWFRWHGLFPCRLSLKGFHESFNERDDALRNRSNGLVRLHLDPRQARFLSEPRHLPFREMTSVSLQSPHRFVE